MKDLDQILKYYRGELNNAEHQAFLKRCKDDPDFAKEVKIFYLTADKHTALKGKQLHKEHLKRKKKRRFIFILFFFLIIIIPLLFILKNIYPFEEIDEGGIGGTNLPKNIVNLDIDGDGIADKVDKCPTTKGTIANNGCPEIKKEDTLTTPIIINDKNDEINDEPNINQNDTEPDSDPEPSAKPLIFANLLPSNSTILEESINVNVIGSGWKGKIQDGKYEEALTILNEKFIDGEPLDEIEDIHLYYTGILELYEKNNYPQSTTLLSAISDDRKYIKLSKLHLFISYIKQEKNNESRDFYLENKVILDEFKAKNIYNISDLINALIN
jgi:hypothetical protein